MTSIKAHNINYTGEHMVINHTTINPVPKKQKKTCKCGSTTHSRINHNDCPLNTSKSKKHTCNAKCQIDRFGCCSILQKKLHDAGF